MLNRFDVSKTSYIPATPSLDLRYASEEDTTVDVPFREIVGSLMWISNQTRPDIANAVRAVARFSHEPKPTHYKAALKILEYLNATSDLGLVFKKSSNLECIQLEFDLDTYVDADYAHKAEDRRSVSGAAICCGGTLVSWFSWTQKCVTLSTTEAEYVAMTDGVKEALYVRGILKFLMPSVESKGIGVFEDNRGAIDLAPSTSSHTRFVRPSLTLREQHPLLAQPEEVHEAFEGKLRAHAPRSALRMFLLAVVSRVQGSGATLPEVKQSTRHSRY